MCKGECFHTAPAMPLSEHQIKIFALTPAVGRDTTIKMMYLVGRKKHRRLFSVLQPKGSIVVECGRLLEKNNYRIKIFNTINFSKSMHYNPFAYIHSEKDILKLVNTLICNTKGDGKSGDDFWVKAETLLYCALIGYIHYEAPEEEQNFATLIELVNAMEVREDDETFENPVDIAFKELEKDKPNHFAVRQ